MHHVAHRRESLFNYSVIDGTRTAGDTPVEEAVWIGYDTHGSWLSLQQAEAVADAIKYLCATKSLRLARNAASPTAVEANASTGRTQAQHPSRSAPLCKDCEHSGLLKSHGKPDGPYVCDHPSMPVSLLSGIASVTVLDARGALSLTQSAAAAGAHCGPDGSLFEPIKHPDQAHLKTAEVPA